MLGFNVSLITLSLIDLDQMTRYRKILQPVLQSYRNIALHLAIAQTFLDVLLVRIFFVQIRHIEHKIAGFTAETYSRLF